jgi:thiosulfate/3-mercaptopyruvate sulfurtransferase
MNISKLSMILICVLLITSCKEESKTDVAQPEKTLEKHSTPATSKSNAEPWTAQQLIQPEELAHHIQAGDSLIIFSLGAGGIIPGSMDTGPSGESESLEKLAAELEKLPRDSEIVIYCGCCPFDICPNVRPAFNLLNSMGFEHHQLLNLEENIKVDWIDKGYPTGNPSL